MSLAGSNVSECCDDSEEDAVVVFVVVVGAAAGADLVSGPGMSGTARGGAACEDAIAASTEILPRVDAGSAEETVKIASRRSPKYEKADKLSPCPGSRLLLGKGCR